jgi:hypothetical protein
MEVPRLRKLARCFATRIGSIGGWAWALIAFLSVAAVARLATVEGTLAFRRNLDEYFLVHFATKILNSGDINPRFFRYPSLPIYLTALNMWFGSWLTGETLTNLKLPNIGGPISPAAGYATARYAFSLLSIATLGLSGFVAKRVYGAGAGLLLAPVLLSTSMLFQKSALHYLNVDIVGTTMCLMTVACVLFAWQRDSYLWKSVLPGALAGLSMASKYNSGLVLLPAILSILLTKTPSRLQKLALLGAAMAFAFLVAVPYSILDHQKFVADVLLEVRHYAKGHRGFDGPPGIPQLAYYLSSLVKDLGPLAMSLAVIGLVFGAVERPRETFVVASFPVAMLLHMSTNRVHFLRTVLPVFVFSYVLAAGGIIALTQLVERLWQRRRGDATGSFQSNYLASLMPSMMLIAAVATHAPRTLLDRNFQPDSRNVVKEWLQENGRSAAVFIAPEAYFGGRQLDGTRGRPTRPELANLAALAHASNASTCYVVVPGYKPTGKGRQASKRVSARLRELRARQVFKVAGMTIAGRSKKRVLPKPVLSPQLTVFQFACSGAANERNR